MRIRAKRYRDTHDMTTLCQCGRIPEPGEPYTLAHCRLCYLHAYCPEYGGDPSVPKRAYDTPRVSIPLMGTLADRISVPCIHRGPATGETVPCQACARPVQIRLYACGLYRACTLWDVPGMACCQTCTQYQREEIAK